MRPSFSKTATWLGKPVMDLTQDELRDALAYKICELRYCYAEMKIDQARAVKEKMKKYELLVPTMSRQDA